MKRNSSIMFFPAKRQFDFNDCADENVKKAKRKCDNDNPLSTSLEDLSNELFYEIFEYLDAYESYKAFTKLNCRFEKLLDNLLLPLHISLSSKEQATIENRCRHVVIPKKDRIRSLHLTDQPVIQSLFDYCNIDSSFSRLESVSLIGVWDYKLLVILFYLKSLPCLFSLTLQLEDDSNIDVNDIYKIIFRLPSLKFLKSSLPNDEDSTISIPIAINQSFSTIEHLVLNHLCSINELYSILSQTPHLRRLHCQNLIEPNEVPINHTLLSPLTNLTKVSFIECDVDFRILEGFIKKIPQIQIWHLNILRDAAYLDADRWKKLIQKHIPHLKEFHFEYHVDVNFEESPNYESINQFTSKFWTERHWFFDLKAKPCELVYSIHPYKKNWYDYHKYQQVRTSLNGNTHQQPHSYVNSHRQQEIVDSCTQLVSSIQFTFQDSYFDTWDLSSIVFLKACFLAVKFTHLKFDHAPISIEILIELMHQLPNVHSLEISSLPLVQLDNLSAETCEILLLVSIDTKVTKVKLDRMVDIEQVQFLMNLCPRMQYLEIGCQTETTMDIVVGSISRNNTTYIPYLSSVCLCVPNANEMTIRNLNTIIDFTSLFCSKEVFRDYTIQRIGDKIFFQWKL